MRRCFFVLLAFTLPLSARPYQRDRPDSEIARNPVRPSKKKAPLFKPEEAFNILKVAIENKAWKEALEYGGIIEEHFKDHPLYNQAKYDTALARYHLGHFVEANRDFSAYLNAGISDHFQDALSYKFEIAQKFGRGESGTYSTIKKIFTERSFPERAVQIYDDILLYAPTSELAAYALFHKAQLLMSGCDYDESIDCFKTLIHDFVGHELLPQCYFGIAQDYYARYEMDRSKEPEHLELAQVNLENFQRDYPSDELLVKSRDLYHRMRAAYAWELYDVGRYFEKRKKPRAAALYYRDICEKFADTPAAKTCAQHHSQVLSLVPPTSSDTQ